MTLINGETSLMQCESLASRFIFVAFVSDRFNALKFLAKMRKKRIMLVGDSIMRNQWESLVCLVQGVVPTGRKTVVYNGPSMAFHAMVIKSCLFVSIFRIAERATIYNLPHCLGKA